MIIVIAQPLVTIPHFDHTIVHDHPTGQQPSTDEMHTMHTKKQPDNTVTEVLPITTVAFLMQAILLLCKLSTTNQQLPATIPM